MEGKIPSHGARLGILLATLLLTAATLHGEEAKSSADADVAAARALFERNLQAIRDQNRDAYLACYLQSERLARTGPEGFQLGYDGLAATAGQGWPDHIAADDIHLTPIRPGLVYGSYRYRVRYGGREDAGLSERLFVGTPEGWKIAVSTAFSALPGVPPPPRALVGATLVDGTGAPPVPDAVVLLRDGRIECAGRRAACPVPAGVDVTDVAGLWITPGLVDAHVHFSQTGWADGRPDSIDVRAQHPYEKVIAGLASSPERFGRSYLCSGVTSVFDVGGYAWTLSLPAWAETNVEVPRVAAAGPLLSTIDHWLNLPGERQFMVLSGADAARSGVNYLAERGSGAVKVWYIVTPEKTVQASADAVKAAGEAARERGLPLIVHATGLAEAKEALRAGAKLLVHSVWDQPVDDEFLDLARKAGTIYCPTLTVSRGYQRMYEGALTHQAPAVDDPNRCVDPETMKKVAETAAATTDLTAERLAAIKTRSADREKVAAANLKRVAEAGIPVAMGTDAGNPLTLHGPAVYAEMEAMQAAGLTPLQVLVAATRGGAKAIGREEDFGTVEKGKLADLLIIAADPTADAANLRKVRYVVRGGVLRDVAELHALATTAADAGDED
jgi:imidazolonepropionase-like amidohydrolase